MADDERQRWLRELGGRMKIARKRAGLVIEDITARLSVSKQLGSAWEKGLSQITAFDLARVALITDSDAAWLLSGKSTAAPAIPEGLARAIPRFPPKVLITVAEALAQRLTKKPADWLRMMAQDYPLVAVHARVSAMAFAIDALDQSLAPEIQNDDIAVVDGDTKPGEGEPALFVLLATKEILLRRFQPGKGGGLTPPFRLDASELFEPRVVTEAHRPFCLGKIAAVIRVYPERSTESPMSLLDLKVSRH